MPQQKSEGCVERRVLRGGQVRAKSGDKPGLTGVASVYNQDYDNGWFIEHVLPGAFTRVLGEDPDVRCLFNHNPDNLLARTKSGTLHLADTPAGLTYDADTNLETTIGRDVQAMVDRGDLDGCSIGFRVAKQNWREEKQEDGTIVTHRDIVEFDELLDVGPVTYPAFTGTSVSTRSLWPQGVPAEVRSHVPALRADEAKTKRVDGEDLTADCFLIVGDPEDTSTWKLPWKFSTEEKTKSHLRNALARFDQLEGVSDEDKAKAKKKLLRLCKQYGIDVSDEESKSAQRDAGDGDADCTCPCDACQGDDCEECDCEGCDSEHCASHECRCANNRARRGRLMRLRLAEHS
jgi:uncharacterized protein